jgi:hypothetical protein
MIKFDPSGLERAFERMEQTAQAKGKVLATQQGNFFLSVTKRLSRAVAPTPQELFALAQQLKWRLKRKPGVSPQKELKRRIRARGIFARGWKVTKVEQAKYRIRIWIANAVSYAGIVEDKHHTTDKAGKVVGPKFQEKLDLYAKDVTGVF